nr:hypothetical protein [Candidatus Woesearchaeota archaeon]
MDNEAWKQRWFNNAGVKSLSKQEKNELREQREEYFKLVNGLNEKILEHKREINQLEAKIEKDRPSIPGASYVHDRCGIKAAIYYGRTPQGGLAGGDDLGYCLYCDNEFLK